MAPFTVGWDPLLRVFVLTLVTVVLAVYLVVPWLTRIYERYLAPRRYASNLAVDWACSRLMHVRSVDGDERVTPLELFFDLVYGWPR